MYCTHFSHKYGNPWFVIMEMAQSMSLRSCCVKVHKNSTYVNNKFLSSHQMLWKRIVNRSRSTRMHLCRNNGSSCGRVVNSNIIDGKVDRYNGIHVSATELGNLGEKQFSHMLQGSLEKWRADGRKGVWLAVPIHLGKFISAAALQGFQFHHAEGKTAMLCQWLPVDVSSNLPIYATHQVGVAGCVLNEKTRELLVIKDKHSPNILKVPGGLSNLGEDIEVTSVREVQEETGVRSDFKSVIAFRQLHDHPNAFGRSDIYTVCRLSPLTFDLAPCKHEVAFCAWMRVDEFVVHEQTTAFGRSVGRLLMRGLERGFRAVDVTSHELEYAQSQARAKTYKLFHRPLPCETP